jgi:prepilin-type N-terminal cleavage/methylation domain-containing protein/prepilin-type processing-associated H-X9-DG protein
MRRAQIKSHAFTLIELLTVIAVIGLLAAMLLPALNSAREKGKRVACSSNLHQIGIAILAFAGDHDNHVPPAVDSPNPPQTAWYTALTNGGYATPKVFVCPDDRGQRGDINGDGKPDTQRSYAIVVGGDAGTNPDPTKNNWIAGSRLTCPALTNSSVAIVGEYYSDTVLPSFQNVGYGYGIIRSPWDSPLTATTFPPNSKHKANAPLAGNYLFLDGHVEWIEKLTTAAPLNNPLALEMFPPPPDPNAFSCP